MELVKYYEKIPEQIGLKTVSFLKWLGDTSIIRAGNGDECLFVSCLIHGLEPSGFYAIHKLLQKLYQQDDLQMTVYFAFMNVEAALQEPVFTNRLLEGQMDMNRVWSEPSSNEKQRKIVDELKKFILEKNPFYILDIHNTSGVNPAFMIIDKDKPEMVELSSYLTKYAIFFEIDSTLIAWASKHTNAMVLECGKNTFTKSHLFAEEALERFLILTKAMRSSKNLLKHNVKLFHKPDKLHINPDAKIMFSNGNSDQSMDAVFLPDIENMNFKKLKKGTMFGWENTSGVIDHPKIGSDNGKIVLKEDSWMAMLTNNIHVIRTDCLGYFIEEYEQTG